MVAVTEITWKAVSAPEFEHPSRQAFRAAVQTVADKARTALPDANGRIDKAVQIVLAGDIQFLEGGKAKVASQSNGTTEYVVCNGVCPCPDYPRAPQGLCKHRLSVAISKRATQLVKGQLTPPGTAQEPVPAQPAHGIPQDHLVFIQGKPFVKYAGLLQLACERGLTSLTADWTHNSDELSLAHAIAIFQDGRRFEESGDSTPMNVGKKVALHWRRLALTRAKSRCLRDALGVGIAALEELADGID